MLSDIVTEPGAAPALLGGSASGAVSAKDSRRKVTEQRAELHQQIIEEYWRRCISDRDSDIQWAQNLITGVSSPRKTIADSIPDVDDGTIAVALGKMTRCDSVDVLCKPETADVDAPCADSPNTGDREELDCGNTPTITGGACGSDESSCALADSRKTHEASAPDFDEQESLPGGVDTNLTQQLDNVTGTALAVGYQLPSVVSNPEPQVGMGSNEGAAGIIERALIVDASPEAVLSFEPDFIKRRGEEFYNIGATNKTGTWIVCIDNAAVELQNTGETYVSVKSDHETVDELVEGILRNIATLIEDSVNSCVSQGRDAFISQDASAAQEAAMEMSSLNQLRSRFQKAVRCWRGGRELDIEDGLAIPYLPGLVDMVNYLNFRITRIDAAICDALLRRRYEDIREFADCAEKLVRLRELIVQMQPRQLLIHTSV